MDKSIDKPLVSVAIPAYKAEKWIGETIRSVQAQTYENLEIIVVDDGSPDRSGQIVEEIALTDPRIRLIRKENGGLPAARNTAIEEAKGEFIAPVDADDLWDPTKIEKQVARALEYENDGRRAGLVYCWSRSIDENGQPTRPRMAEESFEGSVFDELLAINFVGNGSSPLMPREVVRASGAYPEHMRSGCEDWALYLRIAMEYDYAVVPESLVDYRQHALNMSKDIQFMLRGHEMLYDYITEHGAKVGPEIREKGRQSVAFRRVMCAKPFSGEFWRELANATSVDPFFVFRHSGWRLLYLYLLTRIKGGKE